MQSYFVLFDLPASFALDQADLEKRYFAAQRLSHPDRLIGKSPAERQQAIAHSMLINEAYEALKNPLKRAQHMLALAGVTEQKPSAELLMEIMELRESLAETQSLPALETIAQENIDGSQQTIAALSAAFEKSEYAKAGELAMQLSYLMKIEDEIRIRRKIVIS